MRFEATNERLGAVLEDANEGGLMLRSAVEVVRKFRGEEHVVDDEGQRGLIDVESCRVVFGVRRRVRRAFHATMRVGGRKGTGQKICNGKWFLKNPKSLPCHHETHGAALQR